MDSSGFYQTDYSTEFDDQQGGYQQNQSQKQQQFYQPQPSYGGNDFGSSNVGPDPSMYGGGFDDEPPLLEELGIDFDHIYQKTLVVLNPLRQIEGSIVNETDLAGPLIFAFALGSTLLLSGKMHFGYIYGISLFAILMMYCLLYLMAPQEGPSWGTTASILGYCLLPIVMLSTISILFSLQGVTGMVLAIACVLWCSLSASTLFCSALNMKSQQPLVAYPCAMLYGVFALLTIF